MSQNKKIGIIGSGVVGQTLGNGFLKLGFEVMIGTREKTKLINWKETAGIKGSIGSFSEAAAFSDTIILAVSGKIAEFALDMAGRSNLKNKLIIDVTNPIADEPPQNGVLKFFTNFNESLMEKLQKLFPEVKFVKAFNSVGAPLMVNPEFSEGKPTMFICGNDIEAKKTVSSFVKDFGWEPEDMGKAEAARAIEPLCILWCIPGFANNEWKHAFKLLKK